MPRIPGTTDAASTFLRAFHTHPAGPPSNQWPAPAVLRRWLRRPAFRAALQSLQQTFRLQADFHLASAATHAAGQLQAAPDHTDRLAKLLRLSHLRQRFSTDDAPPDPTAPADDVGDAPAERPLTRLDVLHHLHLVEPNARLTPDELREVAWKNHYPLPLRDLPDFPPPTGQHDAFYYNLIKDPAALLWYLHLYDESTGDHRYSAILANCRQLVPRDEPGHPLPRFRTPAGSPPPPR